MNEHSATLGLELAADIQAAGQWETTQGGEYFAVGVLGAVTGRRADVVIIDDPVKSRLEADSETVRDRVWEWWKADLLTRLKPGAKIVLVMTRWHEDDLGGRLLAEMDAGGRKWEVLPRQHSARGLQHHLRRNHLVSCNLKATSVVLSQLLVVRRGRLTRLRFSASHAHHADAAALGDAADRERRT